MAKDTYFYALGRRKSATARVRLQSGKGAITINDKPASDYLSGSEFLLSELKTPFAVIEKDAFDVSVRVTGGGIAGQVDAIKLGIAKSLALMNDPREKERKKFGLKKARKQRQFTKR